MYGAADKAISLLSHYLSWEIIIASVGGSEDNSLKFALLDSKVRALMNSKHRTGLCLTSPYLHPPTESTNHRRMPSNLLIGISSTIITQRKSLTTKHQACSQKNLPQPICSLGTLSALRITYYHSKFAYSSHILLSYEEDLKHQPWFLWLL